MSHEGATRVRHFQPRVIIFQCRTNYRASYVLSYGQPLAKNCISSSETVIGADFRFEVPGQSSVGLIGGGRGQWLGGHHGE